MTVVLQAWPLVVVFLLAGGLLGFAASPPGRRLVGVAACALALTFSYAVIVTGFLLGSTLVVASPLLPAAALLVVLCVRRRRRRLA